jgi:predicted ATP-dependent serine protease
MKNLDKIKIQELSKKLDLPAGEIEHLIKLNCEINGISLDEAMRTLDGKPIKIVPISEAAKDQDKSEKIPCGMESLDEAMSGGISAGSSVVIAAPSGEGKTAFMVSLSYHFLKHHPCLWFSFEENIADIWERFKLTGIEDNTPAFCPLDLSDNKLNYLEDVVKEFKKKNDFFIVFIDQLSFLAPKITEDSDINHIQGNYAMYLGQICNQIKSLAMEYQIIIIFAHQLGRTGEVAYSDMVKHAADKVIYLKRIPDTSQDSTEEFTNITQVVFKKNRPYGNRPKIPMTVENGVFVPIKKDGAIEYAKQLGWKEVNNNLF